MPPPNVETFGCTTDSRIACETMVEPNPPIPSDFPVESFYLPKEDELEWFSTNAYYERNESTKANSNSNPSSKRFSVTLKSKPSSVLGLPKPQDSCFSIRPVNGKPSSIRLFPKRTQSSNRVREPSSPKVSCMGRVRSKKDKNRSKQSSTGKKRTGFWFSFRKAFGGCKSEGVVVDKKMAELHSQKKPVQEKSPTEKTETLVDPPGLGGLNRFVSGRRSESWSVELEKLDGGSIYQPRDLKVTVS